MIPKIRARPPFLGAASRDPTQPHARPRRGLGLCALAAKVGAAFEATHCRSAVNPPGSWVSDGSIRPPPGRLGFAETLALDGVNLIVSARDLAGSSGIQNQSCFHQRLAGRRFLRSSLDEPEDLEGDGCAAVRGPAAVTAPSSHAPPGGLPAVLWFWSLNGFAFPELIASPASVCLASGGSVDLWTSLAPQAQLDLYLVLGSLSGFAQGVPLESLGVPIVPDAWTNYTRVAPNQPPLADTFGILDALGGSAARPDLTPGLPAALSALTAYHATF